MIVETLVANIKREINEHHRFTKDVYSVPLGPKIVVYRTFEHFSRNFKGIILHVKG